LDAESPDEYLFLDYVRASQVFVFGVFR